MPRGRFGGMSISQLESMLQKRRGELGKLRKERAVLERSLAKVDQRIESLGGGKARGGRARNDKSLTAMMEEVLAKAGKPMQVGDIVAKVEAAGYRSSSANFRGIVNQTLIKEKRFGSAGRGLYQLKK
jgi:hypothetical protein